MPTDAEWRILLDALPDPLNVKDRSGRWLYANPAMLRAFRLEGIAYAGLRDSELVNNTHFYHPALCYCERSDGAAWETGEIVRTLERLPKPEGGTDPYEVVKVPVRDAGNGMLLVSSRSAEARVATETALVSAMQDAELGRLLPGLVHDLNNLLTIILGHADLAASHPERAADSCERIIAASSLCRELSTRALNLVRGESGRRRSSDLRPWLQGVIRLCWPRDDTRSLSVELPDRAALCCFDPAMLGRSVLNLLVNARQWTAPQGRILVRLSLVEQSIELSVEDDGPGIPQADQARVFETGFSRREHGTGLGLAQVAHCAEVHGGTCSASTSVLGGCRIGLTLPPGTADNQTSGELPMPQTRSDLRIGLCDPDPIIAGMAQRLAGGMHQVRLCASPQELLQASMRGEFDLIISDLDTPFLDGIQLQQVLSRGGCEVGVVLTTANPHDMRLRTSPPGGIEILLKPYRRAELLTAIDRAMMRRVDGKHP